MTAYPPQYRYTNITDASTVQVFTGPGTLHNVTVNETAAGAITVADSTSTTTPVIALLKASVVEGTYNYDVAVANGLRIVLAAASDVTVSWTQ